MEKREEKEVEILDVESLDLRKRRGLLSSREDLGVLPWTIKGLDGIEEYLRGVKGVEL